MKFDVIVGNPPYQDQMRSGNALWSLFVKKAFDELVNKNGFVAMITPARWVLPGCNIKEGKIRIWDSYIKKLNTKIINLGECSKYFKEGSGTNYFSYFVTQKNSQHKPVTIITNTEKFNINLTKASWLPLRNCNSKSLQIIQKIMSVKTETFELAWKYDRSQKNLVNIKTKKFMVPVFIGNDSIRFSDHQSPEHLTPKVLFKLGRFIEYQKRIMIDSSGDMSYNSAYIVPIKKNDNVNYLKSKLYCFLAQCLNSGSEITAEGYRTLPKLDATRSWTDIDLYKHFNLTEEEIAYVEANFK